MMQLRDNWLVSFQRTLLVQLGDRLVATTVGNFRYGRYVVEIRATQADATIVTGIAMDAPEDDSGRKVDAMEFHYPIGADDPTLAAEEVVRWLRTC